MTGPSFQRAIRTYVDTSVFGGCFDDEFAEYSNRFFEQVRRGAYHVLVSEMVLGELSGAPIRVREVLQHLPTEAWEELQPTRDADTLTQGYLEAGVLTPASRSDATHVAMAAVAGADLVVSWNFRHIVNFDRIRGFNAVNVREGYRPLQILSPREVGTDEPEEAEGF